MNVTKDHSIGDLKVLSDLAHPVKLHITYGKGKEFADIVGYESDNQTEEIAKAKVLLLNASDWWFDFKYKATLGRSKILEDGEVKFHETVWENVSNNSIVARIFRKVYYALKGSRRTK